MWWLMVALPVLAQAPAAGGAPAEGGGSLWEVLQAMAPVIAMAAAAYFLLVQMPEQRERSRRDDFLKNLKKSDVVVTTGGIIGTVANVSADAPDITIKIDDNTRMRVRKTHIEGLWKEPSKDVPPPPAKPA